MAICNNSHDYQLAIDLHRYTKHTTPDTSKGCLGRICDGVFDIIRSLDIFGVPPQFHLSPAGSSIFGCLAGLFIIGLAILFFIFIILNAQNYQTYVQ